MLIDMSFFAPFPCHRENLKYLKLCQLDTSQLHQEMKRYIFLHIILKMPVALWCMSFNGTTAPWHLPLLLFIHVRRSAHVPLLNVHSLAQDCVWNQAHLGQNGCSWSCSPYTKHRTRSPLPSHGWFIRHWASALSGKNSHCCISLKAEMHCLAFKFNQQLLLTLQTVQSRHAHLNLTSGPDVFVYIHVYLYLYLHLYLYLYLFLYFCWTCARSPQLNSGFRLRQVASCRRKCAAADKTRIRLGESR